MMSKKYHYGRECKGCGATAESGGRIQFCSVYKEEGEKQLKLSGLGWSGKKPAPPALEMKKKEKSMKKTMNKLRECAYKCECKKCERCSNCDYIVNGLRRFDGIRDKLLCENCLGDLPKHHGEN